MIPAIDLSKEYGLVLEGGGAKGAYQIGAWKALLEAGVKIKGIAGTSVGGLNGAFICMGDYQQAENIWNNLTYSHIMNVEDEIMAGMFKGKLALGDAVSAMMDFLKNGGVDVTPLKEMIAENIDPETIRNSPMDLYVMTFNVDTMQEEKINVKEVPVEIMQDYFLATAYMAPVFKTEPLHGVHYIDGGAADNVPVDALLENDYKDLIVVRIYGVGVTKKTTIPEDVNIIEIAPKKSLGSIMEFDGKKSRQNIARGYMDAMRVIYNLDGHIYAIDENGPEAYYLKQLLQIQGEVKEEILARYNMSGKAALWERCMTERILPGIAAELKLSTSWTYKELYLAMLEATAKMCRVTKNRVYTAREMLEAIQKKKVLLDKQEKPPVFVIMMKYMIQAVE